MSSVAAAFRLARAGWVLVREGVVAALPGEELSGMPKFGWRVARLFTRRRALSYQRGDLSAKSRGDVCFVNDKRAVCFFDALQHSLSIQRSKRSQIDDLDRGVFTLENS